MENTIKPTRSRVSLWIQATRPFAFSGSVIPVLVAAMAAVYYVPDSINWLLFPVILIAAVLFHTGGNLVSEYFDYKTKVDRVDTFGSSRVLVEELLSPKEVLNGGLLCFASGFVLGLILVYFRGLDILYLGLIGLFGGLFYTMNPFKLKYIALGDLTIFLNFGPVLMLGSYLGLTGMMNYNLIYISIPVAFLVVGILHANNTRDIMHDTQAKIKTLASVIGIKGAKLEYYFLIFGAYISVIIMVILRVLEPYTLIVLLSFPAGLKNVKEISKAEVEKPQDIAMLDVKTAQHHMQFGLLYSIGILLSAFI